ncbi:hypothetical protein NDU88_009478 [Pleurodeles waltl]|uniref:Uncharacterized protein n=1 Tax=Pleurodeles waltl TaxID=8319 RepID=A0AAV7RYK7_PLEWA|nr:hypothetical protein NDU88_009478 [Pleurodeles waltl]
MRGHTWRLCLRSGNWRQSQERTVPSNRKKNRHLDIWGRLELKKTVGTFPFAVIQSRRRQKGINPKQTRRRFRRLFAMELHFLAMLQEERGSIRCVAGCGDGKDACGYLTTPVVVTKKTHKCMLRRAVVSVYLSILSFLVSYMCRTVPESRKKIPVFG